jgi:phosphatidate cytidylyltransferase
MLRLRIATALVLLAAFLGALFALPALGWSLFAAALLAAAAWEWAGFARCETRGRMLYTVATTLGGWGVAWGLGLALGRPGALALIPIYAAALVFWLVAAPLWLRQRPPATAPGWVLAVGWIVLIPTFLALVHLRNIQPALLLAFMLVVWIADIAAYFSGRRFGRRKLAPSVSPGKTWEGFYGALAATAVFALAWITLAPRQAPALVRDLPWGPAWMVAFVAALTALSVIGDLFESALKRQVGLKDSGSILPGHGGVLDRIDALTPVLPAAALVNMV